MSLMTDSPMPESGFLAVRSFSCSQLFVLVVILRQEPEGTDRDIRRRGTRLRVGDELRDTKWR